MYCPVYFDPEMHFRTIEIQNIPISHGILSTKVQPTESMIAQVLPKPFFGLGHGPA